MMQNKKPSPRQYGLLALYFLIVMLVAALGALFQPDVWYANLKKPFWNPPNWVFAPVWSFLYVCIAIAGWKLHLNGKWQLLGLWLLQLILNGIWSWLFFKQHWIGVALVDILLLEFTIGLLCFLALRRIPIAAGWLIPYFLWVTYASTLNAGFYFLNP